MIAFKHQDNSEQCLNTRNRRINPFRYAKNNRKTLEKYS
nr:MAG TPA: hypothetical protein [Caudoviricetes sp.]